MRIHASRLAAFSAGALAALLAAPLQAQDTDACYVRSGTVEETRDRPSPMGVVAVPLGDAEATVCYGRPSAREREIMGALVPYDRPWRTGANEATAIHLPFAATIGGIAVEPGSYSLYTIPGEDEWEIVVSRAWERWGIPIDDEVRSQDVGSFTALPSRTDEMIETFTIRFEPHGEAMGHLVLEWEHIRVEVPVHRTGS